MTAVYSEALALCKNLRVYSHMLLAESGKVFYSFDIRENDSLFWKVREQVLSSLHHLSPDTAAETFQ